MFHAPKYPSYSARFLCFQVGGYCSALAVICPVLFLCENNSYSDRWFHCAFSRKIIMD